ncbi:MAG TPA: hypothetical protein VKP65_14525 [Rhodothermales bacterium]|nr:hypothetical protein [Rhodothermales bacterium]
MLNPDYRDILSIFAEEQVEYLLVGAYALAAYGHPRATGDIDLWIRPDRENAERVMQALSRFGAPLAEVATRDFSEPGIVFQIGIVPRRIDLLTMIDGVADFADAWQRRKEIEIEGIKVPVLSRTHLKQNKRATGRPQDQADLAWLERIKE